MGHIWGTEAEAPHRGGVTECAPAAWHQAFSTVSHTTPWHTQEAVRGLLTFWGEQEICGVSAILVADHTPIDSTILLRCLHNSQSCLALITSTAKKMEHGHIPVWWWGGTWEPCDRHCGGQCTAHCRYGRRLQTKPSQGQPCCSPSMSRHQEFHLVVCTNRDAYPPGKLYKIQLRLGYRLIKVLASD